MRRCGPAIEQGDLVCREITRVRRAGMKKREPLAGLPSLFADPGLSPVASDVGLTPGDRRSYAFGKICCILSARLMSPLIFSLPPMNAICGFSLPVIMSR